MLRFNSVLQDAGIDAREVRLLRHNPQVAGSSLLDLWRRDPSDFEAYQALQLTSARTSFARRYWATFIGTWDGRTVFAGLYEISGRTEIAEAGHDPLDRRPFEAGTRDRYETRLCEELRDLRGRLYIEWGGGASGKRAWNQRANAQDKQITELQLSVAEEPFPGLLAINEPLSRLESAPPSWIEHLAQSRGVYLLSCPVTGKHYVGSATGAGGFWVRWSEYLANGHGNNVALRTREPTDLHASILEVASSSALPEDILAAEALWKDKLLTRTSGLNRN